MKGHGIPVMCSTGPWRNKHGLPAVAGAGRFLRASRFWIHAGCPSDSVDERFCGEELAVLAIEYVEESVLRGLHDDLARAGAERQIREHQGLRGVEVPVVA